jgi:hypothetical protein
MMNELDELLGHLGAEPVPPALARIDGAVIAGLGARREAGMARRSLMLAGLVALLVGGAGALAPTASASAEPLWGMPAAAPSHLLVD